MAKIKELTEMHKKTKLTKEEVKSRLEEELPSDEEKGAKTAAKDKKFVNKNTVAQSKADNKRAQKDAIKKNKQKRGKGTHVEKQEDEGESNNGSDVEME